MNVIFLNIFKWIEIDRSYQHYICLSIKITSYNGLSKLDTLLS